MITQHPYRHATPSNRPNQLSASRFVRTHRSAVEAFPMHCEYACALQGFTKARISVDEWVAFAALVCVVAWAYFGR